MKAHPITTVRTLLLRVVSALRISACAVRNNSLIFMLSSGDQARCRQLANDLA
jgi:hypothetical protein